MNNKILGKEEAEILCKIREKIPEAIIAGGAVRDMVLGKPYGDVDIFLPSRNDITKKYGRGYFIDEYLPEEIFGNSCQGFKVKYGNPYFEMFGDSEREFCVIDTTYQDNKYQLICVPKIKGLFETFDFNCNLVSWDGEKTKVTKTFKAFTEDKVLFQTKDISENLIVRAEKIRIKYPEVTFSPELKSSIKSFNEKQKKSYQTYFDNKKKFSSKSIHGEIWKNLGVFDDPLNKLKNQP